MNIITALVVVGHVASYADPIRLRKGDPVILSGRSDIWDGHCWVWASAPDGREGWIPDDLPIRRVEHSGEQLAQFSADRDYSAVELTCGPREKMRVFELRHGWAWCCNAEGAEGWVPLRNLQLQARQPDGAD